VSAVRAGDGRLQFHGYLERPPTRAAYTARANAKASKSIPAVATDEIASALATNATHSINVITELRRRKPITIAAYRFVDDNFNFAM
jgi:hypothetical protein